MSQSTFKITATAPTRVDLAGGTIDLWPIHNLLDRKATVNVAVSLEAAVTVVPSVDGKFHFISEDQNVADSGDLTSMTRSSKLYLFGLLLGAFWTKDLPPIKVTTNAKSPAGAGLGGSSCLAVAFCRAIAEARKQFDKTYAVPSEEIIVRTAQDVESRVIHAPTGVQDYWGGMRGGINILEYPFGHTVITTLPGKVWTGEDFTLICCYSGKSRASAINNWEIFKRLFDGDKQLLGKIAAIGNEAADCAEAVLKGQWREAMDASLREWRLRIDLWPAIETPETKKIDSAAKEAGAMFTRVGGAGGGGVMGVISPKDRVSAVSKAMTAAGGQVMDVVVGGPGLTVTYG
jgi:D-glycero-alpha-D-manno-heptose-7-phosphate kinase